MAELGSLEHLLQAGWERMLPPTRSERTRHRAGSGQRKTADGDTAQRLLVSLSNQERYIAQPICMICWWVTARGCLLFVILNQMDGKVCKWYEVCPMKRFYEQGKLEGEWVEEYCKGDYRRCVRAREAWCRRGIFT